MAGNTNSVGKSTLSYTGVTAPTPPNFTAQFRAPTPRDYQNYRIGDLWLDLTMTKPPTSVAPLLEDLYILGSKINKVAEWIPFAGSSLISLTGDTGGSVGLDGNNNINVLGTAGRITTTGNPGTNTITWDIGDNVADSYLTDAGTAMPAANILTVTGGTGVTTSAAGSTLTISATGEIATQYTADVGVAIPAANNLNIVSGSASVATSGAGSTITVSAGATVPLQFTSDAGVAIPAANNLNVVGDGINIVTSASGDTITITDISPSASRAAFGASITATIPNVTGNGTEYLIVFDHEFYDLTADYDSSTGIFTARNNGLYFLTSTITLADLGAAMEDSTAFFDVTGTGDSVGKWSFHRSAAFSLVDSTQGWYRWNGSALLKLDSGDTVSVVVAVSGGPGDTADISVGVVTTVPPDIGKTWFTGYQV